MKRYLTICALLTTAFQATAQSPDTAQILVHYKFTHVRDTTNRTNAYTENMVLFVGKNSGSYKSYDRQLQNELFKKQLQQQIANSADGRIRLDRRITGSGTEYYQFPVNKKMVHKEQQMMNSYVIDGELPVINWHISSDKANFGELHCQKATCHFKGRNYTAWFCPDLPVHVGPWKLNGLPGVIVEAYDANKDIVFKFDRVEKAVVGTVKPIKGRDGRILPPLGDDDDTDPTIIQPPAKGIKTTDKEFAKLQDAMHKDPNAFAQATIKNMPDNGGPKPSMNIKMVPPPPINNPIELPEKQ